MIGLANGDQSSDYDDLETQDVIEDEEMYKSLQIDHVTGEASFSHLNFFE